MTRLYHDPRKKVLAFTGGIESGLLHVALNNNIRIEYTKLSFLFPMDCFNKNKPLHLASLFKATVAQLVEQLIRNQ